MTRQGCTVCNDRIGSRSSLVEHRRSNSSQQFTHTRHDDHDWAVCGVPPSRKRQRLMSGFRDPSYVEGESVSYCSGLTMTFLWEMVLGSLPHQHVQDSCNFVPTNPQQQASPQSRGAATPAIQYQTLGKTRRTKQKGHDKRSSSSNHNAHSLLGLLIYAFVLFLSPADAQQVVVAAQQCKLFLAVSDVSRDNYLSTTEYLSWLARITGNSISPASFDQLPESLKTLYTTSAAPENGEIDIHGAHPITATVSPAQGATLDALCTGVETALAESSIGDTPATGPVVFTTTTTTTATSLDTLLVETAAPGTTTPGVVTTATTAPAASAAPTTSVRTCTISMAVSDADRNNALSPTEYLGFVNRITTNRYSTVTDFANLPQSLQDGYTNLLTQSGAAELPITGASPSVPGTPEQTAFLEQICAATDAAIAAATSGGSLPSSINPSTVSPALGSLPPQTTGPGTVAPSTGGVATGSIPPETVAPGTIPSSTLSPDTGSLGPGSFSPGTTGPAGTVLPSTMASGSTMAPTTPVNTCKLQMALADADKNSLMSPTEYITFVNRLGANQWVSVTTLQELPQPLQDAYNKVAAGNEIDINGALPSQVSTEAQQLALQSFCASVDQAMALARSTDIAPPSTDGTALPLGSVQPSTTNPGTAVPGTGTPATEAPTTALGICKLQIALTDMDKNSRMSPTDYVGFINRMASSQWISVTTLEGLPQPLQDAYNQFAAGNEIDIFGASPGQEATPAQLLALQNFCAAVDQAIALVRSSATQPPSTGSGPIGAATSGPTQDTATCKIRMNTADRSRDEMLDADEYLLFVNFLTSNGYSGATFASLPSQLQDNFNSLVNVTTGQITIIGANPAYAATASSDQVAALDKVCIQTNAAIQSASATSLAPGSTDQVATVSPGVNSTRNSTADGGPGSSTTAPITIDPNSPVVTIYSSFLLSSARSAAQLTEDMNLNRLPIENAYQQFVLSVASRLVSALNGQSSLPKFDPPSNSSSTPPITSVPSSSAPPGAATAPSTGLPTTGNLSAAGTIPPIGTVPPSATVAPPISNSTVAPATYLPSSAATTQLPGATVPSVAASDAPTLPGGTLPPASTSIPAGSNATFTPTSATMNQTYTQLPTTLSTTAPPLSGTPAAATQVPNNIFAITSTLPATPAAATLLPTALQTTTGATIVPETSAPIRRVLRGYWRRAQELGTAGPATASPGSNLSSIAPAAAETILPGISSPGSDVPASSTVSPVTADPGLPVTSTAPGLPVTSTAPGLPVVSTAPETAGPSTVAPLLSGSTSPATNVTSTATETTAPGTAAPLTQGSTSPATNLPSTASPDTSPPGSLSTADPGPPVASTAPQTVGPSTVPPLTPGSTSPASELSATVSPLVSTNSTSPPSMTTPPPTATSLSGNESIGGGSAAPPTTPASGPPGSESVSLDSTSARILRFEESSACPVGLPADKPFCLVAFAEYGVMVFGDVDRQAVYDTLVEQTQNAIQAGDLEAFIIAQNSSEFSVLGVSDPALVGGTAATTPPTSPNPLELEAPNETEKTYLGLGLGGFLGIVLVLVCMTCVACGCFGYVIYNLKQGNNADKQDGPTKDASDRDDDDEEKHAGGLANVEPAGASDAFGGFQVEPGEGLFDVKKDEDDSSTESEEERPSSDKPEQAKSNDAEFGFEIGGPDLPDEFKVNMDGDEYSSEDESKGGFVNRGSKEESESESEEDDFGGGFGSNSKEKNGFFTKESNGFFGGGNQGWANSQESESSPSAPPAGGNSFGFETETDDGSSVYTDNDEEKVEEQSGFGGSRDEDSYSSASEEEESGSESEMDEEEREAIREQIVDLVREAAPHELGNIDMMMEQFEGREGELLETLKVMHSKKEDDDQEESFASESESEGDESEFDEGSKFEEGESQYEEGSEVSEGQSQYEEGESQYSGEEGESRYSGDEGESQYSDEYEDEGSHSGDEASKGDGRSEDFSDSDYS